MPAVSVVMPFRNAGDTLPECLESLAAQTLEDFEAVLVDDGSEDGSARLVRERMRGDERIRLLSPGRVGLVKALNLGAAHTRSNLIARMDADDIMHPERLRLQRDFLLSRPDVSVLGSRVELFPKSAVRNGYREYARWLNECLDPGEIASNLYVESPLAHPSVMMRRAAFEAAGGYREGPFPEDYELWLRMHEAGLRMAKAPEVLLSWRERVDRTSRTDERYSRESFDRLRARFLARDPRLGIGRDLIVWGAGRTTRGRVRRLLDRGVRIHGWVDIRPGRIGKKIWGLPVHSHAWLDRDPKPFVLVYVTNHGARGEIAAALRGWGYVPGRDCLAVG
jgi:glycosyltransferase involved in cell wall biosynthesis